MLKPGAVLKFFDFEVLDAGITVRFLCQDPGPGEASLYSVTLSDADLTSPDVLGLVTAKLKRKLDFGTTSKTIAGLFDQEITL